MKASSSGRGIVYLVGAGPGDPGLITVRGVECLQQADVVIYDRLANRALLDYARHAQLVDVGKEPDRHAVPQSRINALLLEHAGAGKMVVRLKGGDPFVFGRGGEEAEALAAAGIPFVIVPGVSSAVAGPAYAGIPVTHRDLASSVTIATGHRAACVDDPACDWRRVAGASGTLIYLMGVRNLPHIVAATLEAGRPPTTPVAVIQEATCDTQRTVTGTLDNIVALAGAIEPPAVIVIGEAVRLRDKLNWHDERGQTVARQLRLEREQNVIGDREASMDRERSVKKGLVIVYTGNGKGKTTAALGTLLRAWGHGMQVAVVQFLKNEHARFGEIRAAEKLGIDWTSTGDGFSWRSRNLDETAGRTISGWDLVKEKIASGRYHMLLLDEFTYPLHYGWLNTAEVVDWLRANKPPMLHLIITGRSAPPELIEYADLVTEMGCVKHPFAEQGIGAQLGVEF